MGWLELCCSPEAEFFPFLETSDFSGKDFINLLAEAPHIVECDTS